MIYRRLTETGDYNFGRGKQDFLMNSPDTVGQAILTRLRLWTEEWFLDTKDGTPWREQVLGKYTSSIRDVAIRLRVLGTPGVTAILSYTSEMDDPNRTYSVRVIADTVFGAIIIKGIAEVPIPKDRLDINFYLDGSFLL